MKKKERFCKEIAVHEVLQSTSLLPRPKNKGTVLTHKNRVTSRKISTVSSESISKLCQES